MRQTLDICCVYNPAGFPSRDNHVFNIHHNRWSICVCVCRCMISDKYDRNKTPGKTLVCWQCRANVFPRLSPHGTSKGWFCERSPLL